MCGGSGVAGFLNGVRLLSQSSCWCGVCKQDFLTPATRHRARLPLKVFAGFIQFAAMGTGASKVEFRQVLQQLGGEDISVDDAAFWSRLWKTESTPHVSAMPSGFTFPYPLACV